MSVCQWKKVELFTFDEPFEIFISDESIKERKIHTKKTLN